MTDKESVQFDLSDRHNMFYWQTNRNISAVDMKTVFLDRRNTVTEEDTIAAIEYGLMESGKSKNASQVEKLDEPIPFGSVNNVLKARISDGSSVVVRMHPYFVQNGYFWSEKVANDEARKHKVPTIKTIFIDDSKRKFNFDYMIMEELPGKVIESLHPLSDKLEASLSYETGVMCARIHKVHPIGFGFFINREAKNNNQLVGQYTTFREHIYAALVEDLNFLSKTKVITKNQRENIENIFDEHSNFLNIENSVLIHNDVADWNQVSDGKKITGMLDWDECCGGDPVMEFSAYSLFYDENRLKQFKNGYQSVSKLPDSFDEKFHLYRLRYLISKLHLRKKRVSVLKDSQFLEKLINRAMIVLEEEFEYFGL